MSQRANQMTGKFYENCKIVSNVQIGSGIFAMTVHAPEMAEKARPGQFAMLYIDRGEMTLPRPISFCDANKVQGTVYFVYKIVGAGTRALSELQGWNKISVLGPLGNGFALKKRDGERFSRVAVVGGGIGIPPLHLLAKSFAELGTYVDIYLGFSNMPIMLERFRHLAGRLVVATEDGSYGKKGMVVDFLAGRDKEYDEILACGPKPMISATMEFGKRHGITCQLSLEERMACGLGACVGCSIKVKDTYVRVCAEGPVFYDDEVKQHG